MASRRDELNAYTYAKRRLVAQFLRPSPSGTEEGAPKPVRAVLPGVVIGVLIMVGFGAWGMFQPNAPQNWDKPEQQVLVGDKSTTRYVVLHTGNRTQLHPVLNYASARLLLKPQQSKKIVKVDEKLLDSGKPPHGATIGIPYAPDRLPTPGEAGASKRWAVCERPAEGGRSSQKAAFVFAKRDMKRVEGPDRLRGGQVAYVQGTDGEPYIVDRSGTKYPLNETGERLTPLVKSVLQEERARPQRVSQQWLNTLHNGRSIAFPKVPGTVGAPSNASATLDRTAKRVGTVLQDQGSGQQYVVTRDSVQRVSNFTARLLLDSPEATANLDQHGKATGITPSAVQAEGDFDPHEDQRPTERTKLVNYASPHHGARNTVCNVLRGVGSNGRTTLSTWVGRNLPAPLPAGSSSAYVTPGSGQLFRQFQGNGTKSGGTFLATDNGLRYALQSNTDSSGKDAGIGSGGRKKAAEDRQQQGRAAQTRLGYQSVTAAPVPYTWAQYLPTGPRLSSADARQPQGS